MYPMQLRHQGSDIFSPQCGTRLQVYRAMHGKVTDPLAKEVSVHGPT
jgi:hypothetical protein